ncbi:MAG: 2,3-bisphosphoglycerate-dependent phosphoglycerate mutase [SAR86 cluster bacterium]|uniref:2,3-bisphosphoglycerate-dependent phosphoglycerate mutase n=1 Tax=SAR86 cluster bacterium TaxID=2030880 RepID=A0A937IGJ4_9GAMM|nr:2,3-bisphosphoglycerate-dependent phosphoglycerate mutase [SAR86 cluster bacterium]MBL6820204.1 2,3-bisphosphoglycerate-dependent phosphoglycerate mutase [SAR86 cluster bacterium]
MKSNILVLVRHGQSEWNKLNLFTGWKDPNLTQQGITEASQAGAMLKEMSIKFDLMYTSVLRRAQLTGTIILEKLDQLNIPIEKNVNLNERDYGDLTGMNKDQARAEFGDKQVHIWRRSYDIPPPGGESLKNTYDRVVPYFKEKVLPQLESGKNILIAAHGNSLRSLVKYIENISEENILKFEIATGEPLFYEYKSGNLKKVDR